jgi:CHAD domain-containing protein
MRQAPLGDLVRHALAHSTVELMQRDPGVRLGEDPEDGHRFRVAARRLRSNLHTFAPLLEPGPARELRDELRWIGSAIGAVRDNDVLTTRLRRHSRALPEPDQAGAHLLLSLLADQGDAARTAMLVAFRSRRYVSLLDALVGAANDPPFRPGRAEAAARPAARAAGKLVRRPWRRLAAAVAALDDDPSDPELHDVRILAKRCRYAVEAVAPVTDQQAAHFAAALADVQSALGSHQDAVVAEAWLRAAQATTTDAAIAAGELILVQQRHQTRLRARWPATWKAASAKRLRSWI